MEKPGAPDGNAQSGNDNIHNTAPPATVVTPQTTVVAPPATIVAPLENVVTAQEIVVSQSAGDGAQPATIVTLPATVCESDISSAEQCHLNGRNRARPSKSIGQRAGKT